MRTLTWTRKTLIVWLAATLLAGWTATPVAQPATTAEQWVATWGTAQQLVRLPPAAGARGAAPPATPVSSPPGTPARRFPVPREISSISEQTVRMIVRTSIGGQRVRVRLTNAFGATTVTIGAAHIALRKAASSIVPDSTRVLTFSGKPTARLYAGQVLISDPVDLAVPSLTDLAVSFYIVGDAGVPTGHRFGLRPTYLSTTGNYSAAASIDDIATTSESVLLARRC